MSDRVRVTLLAGQLGRGGAEAQLVELACGVDRARFDVSVLLLAGRNAHAERLAAAGVAVASLGKRGWWDVGVPLRLIRHLRRERPDILHSTLFHANLLAAGLARRAGVRALVLSQRGSYQRHMPLPVPAVWRRLARRAVRNADALIVNSEAAAREEREAGVPGAKIVVIPNGVAVADAPSATRAELRLPDGPLVVSVGRLEPVKGLRHLIDAWPRVVARHPRAVLAVVGDGSLRDALREQARQSGATEAMLWLGERPARPYIAAADVLVQSALSEGMPNAVLEAMALGTPVVATAVGGTVEIVADGRTGLLVPVADPAALADAVCRLLADREAGGRMAAAARDHVRETHSLTSMVAATMSVYDRVRGRTGSGARRVLVFGQRPFPNDHAALESVFTRELPRLGYTPVWVLPPADPSVAAGTADWNGTTVHVTRRRWWRGPLRHLELVREYLREGSEVLTNERTDLVQARTGLPEALAAWWLASRHHTPFVFQCSFPVALSRRLALEARGPRWLARAAAAVENRLRGHIEKRADLILAVSDEMARDWPRGSPRVEVLPLGADVSVAPADVTPVSAPPLSVIYFGSMDGKRDLPFLLRAFARVAAALPEAHLLMLGDARGSGLEEAARAMGLAERVTFLGRVPRREVPRYLRAARCSVAAIPPTPLYRVSSATKVVESLAMAVPVVANREIPDQRHLVEASGGGYCPPYEEAAIAEAVVALLADPEDAARRGRAGRSYVVAHRSYAVLAERLAGWYGEALATGGQERP